MHGITRGPTFGSDALITLQLAGVIHDHALARRCVIPVVVTATCAARARLLWLTAHVSAFDAAGTVHFGITTAYGGAA